MSCFQINRDARHCYSMHWENYSPLEKSSWRTNAMHLADRNQYRSKHDLKNIYNFFSFQDLKSKEMRVRQRAVALYFIGKPRFSVLLTLKINLVFYFFYALSPFSHGQKSHKRVKSWSIVIDLTSSDIVNFLG